MFLQSNEHPRAYGNFVRVLAKYVRDEKVISLEQAIRKLSGLPARNLSIKDRGLLRRIFRGRGDLRSPHGSGSFNLREAAPTREAESMRCGSTVQALHEAQPRGAERTLRPGPCLDRISGRRVSCRQQAVDLGPVTLFNQSNSKDSERLQDFEDDQGQGKRLPATHRSPHHDSSHSFSPSRCWLPRHHATIYTFEPQHAGRDFLESPGFANPTAQFNSVAGTLDFDQADPAARRSIVTIPLTLMSTGVADLNDDFKSPTSLTWPDFRPRHSRAPGWRGAAPDMLKVVSDLTCTVQFGP